MNGLNRFEKSQILGSQIRVDDFLRSGSVLKSRYYDEPLRVGEVGYNIVMEKLTKDSVDRQEETIIYDWLKYSECKQIRSYFYGNKVESKYKSEAIILEKMLKKYDNDLDKSEHIFRRLKFFKNDFAKQAELSIMISTYENALKNNGLIRIDKAPSSFTRNKDVAFNEFAMVDDNNYNSLVFQLIHREKGELYIKDFAGNFAYQDEIVVKSHNSLYEVVSIEKQKDTTIIKIKEIPND